MRTTFLLLGILIAITGRYVSDDFVSQMAASPISANARVGQQLAHAASEMGATLAFFCCIWLYCDRLFRTVVWRHGVRGTCLRVLAFGLFGFALVPLIAAFLLHAQSGLVPPLMPVLEFVVANPLLRWLGLLFVAATMVVYFVSFRRWRADPTPRCTECGYNLTGNVSGRCPECGSPCAKATIA